MQKICAKEYKTRHICVRKVIHKELCKKFKFDLTNQWYMSNLESALENETHKVLRDFEIQTDHLISARQPNLVIVDKKKKKKKKKKKQENPTNSGFYRSGWPQSKIKRKRKGKWISRPCQRTKKIWNMKVMVIPVVIGVLRTILKGLIKGLEDL